MSSKKTEINLRCEYSAFELDEKRDELSAVTLGAREVEGRKADSAKAFKETLDALYSRQGVLATQIKARGEFRAVIGLVEFNKPQDGLKQIIRLDTGEMVSTEPMTMEERQDKLFTQLEEDFKNDPPKA